LRKTCSTSASRCAQAPPPAQPHEAHAHHTHQPPPQAHAHHTHQPPPPAQPHEAHAQPPPHAPAEGADACDAHAEVKVGALSVADRKPSRRHARYSVYFLCLVQKYKRLLALLVQKHKH
jgi:hypothetical protein